MDFSILCWLALQLSAKGDNNLPTEAETEEKEMDTLKEDDLSSDKTSKEVCESFFLCNREHRDIMFIGINLLLHIKTVQLLLLWHFQELFIYVKLSVC